MQTWPDFHPTPRTSLWRTDLTDEAERKAAMSDIAQIELAQAIAEKARRKFLK